MPSDKAAVEKLQQLYKKDRIARSVFDYLASYQRNRRVTRVDYLWWRLKSVDPDISRSDIVRLLKQLEELGFGRYVPGRWSYPSRFEWTASLIEVGKAASGEEETVLPLSESTSEAEEEPELIGHPFQLRTDMQITIELPGNLTRVEASRLAKFIEALPFSE